MSQDHERLFRQALRAFNEHDIEGIVATAHPEAEIELIGGFADVMGKRFSGLEGVRRFYTDWFATFKTMHIEPEKLLEAGEQLVALTKLDATVQGSDAPVELLSGIVCSFKDGKISRSAFYYDRQEALKAAGLSD